MKNKLFSVVSVFAMMVGIFAFSTPAPAAAAPALAICGTEFYYTLYAGQTIDAGTVTVSNDANNLYVTFETSGDWWLDTTHLHVATTQEGVPAARNGNPIPGQFDYQTNHDPRVQTYTYTVAKSAIEGFDTEVSGSLVIAAHAALVRIVDGEVVQTETGWGNGTRFVTKGNWGMYIAYEWQTCIGGPAKYEEVGTAYAYGGDDATCFIVEDLSAFPQSLGQPGLNLAHDGHFDTFNLWGWSNGPLAEGSYTWELWAGAAHCETYRGTLVGTVTVNYEGSTATVTYNMIGDFVLGETHLYVGSEPMPRDNNGHFTSAKGQFGNIHDPSCEVAGEQVLAGCVDDSYEITELSGDIYIVAHAVAYQPAP